MVMIFLLSPTKLYMYTYYVCPLTGNSDGTTNLIVPLDGAIDDGIEQTIGTSIFFNPYIPYVKSVLHVLHSVKIIFKRDLIPYSQMYIELFCSMYMYISFGMFIISTVNSFCYIVNTTILISRIFDETNFAIVKTEIFCYIPDARVAAIWSRTAAGVLIGSVGPHRLYDTSFHFLKTTLSDEVSLYTDDIGHA